MKAICKECGKEFNSFAWAQGKEDNDYCSDCQCELEHRQYVDDFENR